MSLCTKQIETAPPQRSFKSIARMLSIRYGTEISSAEVEEVCARAQSKILRALLSDPELRESLQDR